MAHMYPQRLRPETKSRAERTLYQAFADSLPDDYTVFHGVRWLLRDARSGARDGEADFLIVHPDRGIIVLEVKGGRIRYDGPRDGWYSNNNEIKDPFVQAETNKYSLLEMLKAAPTWRGRWLMLGHAVAFPDVVVDRDLRLDAPREIILDAADAADVKRWVERAMGFYAPRDGRPGGVGSRSIRVLIDILAPSVEIAQPLSTAIAGETREIIRLTEEQFDILNLLTYQRRVAIAGCAGSGKTMLACEQARRLGTQGFRVLLTCFNSALADHLSQLDLPSCTVASFHQLCSRLARDAGVRLPRGQGDDYFSHVLPEALLEAASRLGAQYDAVVVDEAQDFAPDWWVPLQALLDDPDHGILYVFYDDNQNLYQPEGKLPRGLQRYPLTKNCRNTRLIHETFLPFYRSEILPQTVGPEGRPPEVLYYGSERELQQRLSQALHQLVVNERVPAEDIVILTPRAPDKSNLARWRALGNLRPTTSATPGPGEVRYTSIYQFKGLEAPVVIVAEFRPAGVQDADTLLYVGCSRARNHLVIVADEGLPEEVRARLPETG